MTTKLNISLKTLFIYFLFFFIINNMYAQGSRKENNEAGFKDRLWYGINMGNIGLGYNQFYINLSFMGGVKIMKNWNAGAIIHTNYTYLWQRGNNPSYNIFDYGFGGLTTVKIYRRYFAQFEADKMYKSGFNIEGELKKLPYLFTYIGGGYQYNSPSKWSMIITLLYNINPDTNREFFPLDYRAAFVYNF